MFTLLPETNQRQRAVIVHDWVEQLLKVQEKDLRIGKLQEQVDAVPREKAKVQAMLDDEKKTLETVKAKVVDEEKRIKTLEIEAESLQAKQRDFESKSTMIKNNEDYRAALHQIEMCKHKISELEEQELVLMEDLEAARVALADEKKAYAATEKRAEQMGKDLNTRAMNCQAQIDKLQAERDELAASVPSTNLNRYDRVRKNRPPAQPVLVPVDHSNICGGCHMNLPAQDRVNAARGQSVSCPNCGALVYYSENA
jgi:predicted  nucleic acid-binding Zn-ribbon protein